MYKTRLGYLLVPQTTLISNHGIIDSVCAHCIFCFLKFLHDVIRHSFMQDGGRSMEGSSAFDSPHSDVAQACGLFCVKTYSTSN